jgi:teichoic acid transport system permease protein
VVPFGGHITWRVFLLLPLTAIFTVFNLGVALVVARLTVHFRDLSQLMPFITRILFYTAGVFFDPVSVLKHHPTALTAYHLYPLNEVLAIGRSLLIPGHHAPLYYWWALTIWAVVALVFGIFYFWSAEERYGRDE